MPAPAIERYGRYESLFRIASGGMAEVFAARMIGEGRFEKIVALKRMLPNLVEDERFEAMFLDEGRLAANLASPHVVQTLDLGRADDGSLYLVMELVVGASLGAIGKELAKARARGEDVRVPVPIAIEVIAQAAQGLHDAHEARAPTGEPLGIVHRDVSPANVLVDLNGRVRISDFGVARAIERSAHTQQGEVKGKIAYFSPEQARAKVVDRRTDVFALGIVAWELVAGEKLFEAAGPQATLRRVFEHEIPRLDALRADVPAALADAVARALERDLDRRTPSADALARDVRASGEGASAAEIGEWARAHGGEQLARLVRGLRSLAEPAQGGTEQLAAPPAAGRVTAPIALPDDPGTITREAPTRPRARDEDVAERARTRDEDIAERGRARDDDVAEPTRLRARPEDAADPTRIRAAPPPRRDRRGVFAALAVGIAIAIVAALAWSRGDDTITVTPLAPVAPIAPTSAPVMPVAPIRPPPVATPDPVAPVAPDIEPTPELERHRRRTPRRAAQEPRDPDRGPLRGMSDFERELR